MPGSDGAQNAPGVGALISARPARARRAQKRAADRLRRSPGGMSAELTRAARLGLGGHGQLQHFAASPAWDDAPLWTVLAQQADRLVGGKAAYLVIDDMALPKKGTLSAGVARQHCGQLGGGSQGSGRKADGTAAGGKRGELPVAGVAHARAGRSAGAGGLAGPTGAAVEPCRTNGGLIRSAAPSRSDPTA